MGPLEGSCVSRGEPCSSERCCMRMTIPVPGRLGCRLPQQLHHRPAVWSDGVVPGWGPQAAGRVDPHASAGGHYLCELSPLGHLMDRPLRPPWRTRVHRHAPSLDGYFPGSNAAEQPHRGGELYVAPGALNFSREQGRTAAPLPIPSTSVVAWGNPRVSERPSGSS